MGFTNLFIVTFLLVSHPLLWAVAFALATGNPLNGPVSSCRAAATAPRTLVSIDGPATAQGYSIEIEIQGKGKANPVYRYNGLSSSYNSVFLVLW